MKKLQLKLWVKVVIIIIISILTYSLITAVIKGKKPTVTTTAQINSVEMFSIDPVFGSASLKVTNLTDAGFNVVWISEGLKEGIVGYGVSKTEMTEHANDERITLDNRCVEYNIHSVKISKLKATTDYFITSYLSGEQPAFVHTPRTLSSPPAYIPISGTFKTDLDISEALFIFTMVDEAGNPISTSISTTLLDNYSWLTSIGDMRNLDTWNYMDLSIKDEKNKMRIEVYTIKGAYTIDLELKDVLNKELEMDILLK